MKHSKNHSGFKKIAKKIAKREHVSIKRADAMLAFKSRNASASAKRRNPRLKLV